ncbi:hypothetical protein GTQ40_14700 [Flavobacteriaceae bacterium R38]|nr:hypothetical protein [Flavobacteriaceae bacterium R38]
MNQEVYKKIEAYLGGSMSPEEIILFENELKENQSLREEVKLYGQLNRYLGDKGLESEVSNSRYVENIKQVLAHEETAQIKDKLKSIGDEYHQSKASVKRKKYLLIAAAAIILIAMSIGVQFFSNNKTLYDEYYNANDLPSLVNRGNTQDLLIKGSNLFEEKKYREALDAFSSYQKNNNEINNQVTLYMGMLYLELNESDKALDMFDLVITSNKLNSSKGLWFKALTYLRIEDTRNAELILKEIVKKPSNFKFKEAKELLDRF